VGPIGIKVRSAPPQLSGAPPVPFAPPVPGAPPVPTVPPVPGVPPVPFAPPLPATGIVMLRAHAGNSDSATTTAIDRTSLSAG
jgi:hypothetical protein